MNRFLVALEISLEMEVPRADRADVSTDVLAVAMLPELTGRAECAVAV